MQSAGPGRRVLVCDDTPSIRHLIRLNLELEGYEVEEVSSADEALERLLDTEAGPADLVLLDAHMAPRDGWWLIARIRGRRELAGLPVVLVTAALHGHDENSLASLGFDGVLAKPFDPDELLEVVSRTTASSRATTPDP